ncbi:hypothetical protein RRG08_000132 [Elysia crispata]|uniref:Uncharacterized protein n=1 Tax=Elysia crispata TaxID=231223 RepID=A0AAE0YWM4_9GAST|nr:hypothetical protein RRG08_000132 [Elysia crispata]
MWDVGKPGNINPHFSKENPYGKKDYLDFSSSRPETNLNQHARGIVWYRSRQTVNYIMWLECFPEKFSD